MSQPSTSLDSDIDSTTSVVTVVFDPTIDLTSSGSWPVFPPPITLSPEVVAANHNPSIEALNLPALGSEPVDAGLRVRTGDLVSDTQALHREWGGGTPTSFETLISGQFSIQQEPQAPETRDRRVRFGPNIEYRITPWSPDEDTSTRSSSDSASNSESPLDENRDDADMMARERRRTMWYSRGNTDAETAELGWWGRWRDWGEYCVLCAGVWVCVVM